jgi:hypothetical protein
MTPVSIAASSIEHHEVDRAPRSRSSATKSIERREIDCGWRDPGGESMLPGRRLT